MGKMLVGVSIMAIVVALALVALGLPNVNTPLGRMSDRQMEGVIGGGHSVGCKTDGTASNCKGTDFKCPEEGYQEVYGSDPFTGCTDSGKKYKQIDLVTVQTGAPTGNTKIPHYYRGGVLDGFKVLYERVVLRGRSGEEREV